MTSSPRSLNRRLSLLLGGAAAVMAAPAIAAVRPEAEVNPWHAADLYTIIDLHNDYTALGKGGSLNAFVVRGDWAPEPYFSLRADVPLSYAGPAGQAPSIGLGDVMLRPLARVVGGRFGVIAGADFTFNSASEPALGTGKNQIGPLVILSYEIEPKKAWVRLQAQHTESLGGDPARAYAPATSIMPMLFTALPQGFWLYTGHKMELRHRGPVRAAYTGVFEVGKELEDGTMLYVDPGVEIYQPLGVDWLVTVGARWVMK